MRAFKVLIIFLLVAMTVFIVVGMADLRSQSRYAARMNAPAFISTTSQATETAGHFNPGKTKKNAVAGQKTKNQNL